MSTRRPLTFAGSDVAPILRLGDDRCRVVFLDRFGNPSTHTADTWAHELRGIGWHLAAIKQLISLLPAAAGQPEAVTAAPYRALHAHRTHQALNDRD